MTYDSNSAQSYIRPENNYINNKIENKIDLKNLEKNVKNIAKNLSPSVVSIIVSKEVQTYKTDPFGFFQQPA